MTEILAISSLGDCTTKLERRAGGHYGDKAYVVTSHDSRARYGTTSDKPRSWVVNCGDELDKALESFSGMIRVDIRADERERSN
jgi:hypothetical protein